MPVNSSDSSVNTIFVLEGMLPPRTADKDKCSENISLKSGVNVFFFLGGG